VRSLSIPIWPAAHFNRGGLIHALLRLDEALISYNRAVELQPAYAEAFSNRGNVLFDLKRLDEACASYDRAVQLKPDYAEVFNNRGTVLQNLNRPAEALASYDRAVQLKGDYAEAFYNRGNTLVDLKRPNEALASYDRAVQIKPDYAQAFYNRGNLLLELKRPEKALASYDRVVQLKPDDADAFNNRGNALLDLKRADEALASYDCALTIRPDHAEACNNRGKALFDLQRLDEACASFDRAVQLNPGFAEAFSNRGDVLRALKRPHEALASFDRAVQLKPDYAEALNNRGNLLRDPLKRLDEALESFGRALQFKPDFVAPRYNSGIANLLAGHYREGWADCEWRWEDETHPEKRPTINAPAWQGEALTGCRIAIYCEQGLGDIIQFARYLPLLVQRGAKVTFFAPPKLTRLLRTLTCEIAFVSAIDDREPFDFQCALMSLPLWFGTELSSIPNNFPYLHAEKDLVSQWKEKIAGRGFKIGIAWQGSPSGDKGNKGRSIPLAEFLPLSQVPGIRLISLQKGYGVEQLATLPATMKVETLGSEFDSGPDAFIDTAALMSTLDLVLTLDTSIAHLAGALGCSTWLALKYVPDWRWLLDREDSPWYPTMRLFRQQADGDWKSVFTKIAGELRSSPPPCP
jgi:tetratricopeptide (TPR) repeat protein